MNYIKMFIAYIYRSTKNYLISIILNNYEHIYLPNLGLKNIINVNPNKIKFINSVPLKFNKSSKFILNYDWGKNNKIINDCEKNDYKFIACEEFSKNIKIKKTHTFEYFKKKIINLKHFKGCKNENDIINFLNSKKKLYKKINKYGLQKKFNNNIEFMVDENLNLIKINSGDYRFAISRVLKLKKIPIEIKFIHKKCFDQNFRNQKILKEINQIIRMIEKKYA